MSTVNEARPIGASTGNDPLLSVQNLHISFDLHPGLLHAVRGVSVDINADDHTNAIASSATRSPAVGCDLISITLVVSVAIG